MGYLFTGSGTFTLNPETTLATFEGGRVCSPAGALGTGHETLMYYDGGRIYRSVTSPFGDGHPNVLARCSKFGRIETEGGLLLGYCEQGEVKDSNGRVIAYYEGDTYGAAAAACAVIFGLSDPAKAGNPDNQNSGQANEGTRSGGDKEESALELILSIVGLALVTIGKVLWKLIKTMPFWGPYAFTILLPIFIAGIMVVAPAGAGAATAFPPLAAIAGLSVLLYPILHTVLLLKCRKRQEKNKYRPVYIAFALFVVTFAIAFCVPAVAFQIIWLVQEHKKKVSLQAQQEGEKNDVL